MLKGVILAGGIVAFGCIVFGALGPVAVEYLIGYWGYFVTAFLVSGAAWLMGRAVSWRELRRGWSLDRWQRAVFLALVSLFTLTLEPFSFKIVWDEPLLGATAASMHFDRLALVPTAGNASAGPYEYLDGIADKRPLAFPFLISLLHDLSGYRPTNAFVLNALLIPVFWWLLFWLGRRLRGAESDGYLSVLLVATLPLVFSLATSGGFDFFNTLLTLLAVFWALRWHDDPDDTRQLHALLGTLWLLANTRYEGPLWILPFGLFILWQSWRMRRFDFSFAFALSPWSLLLPAAALFLQNRVQIFWQPGPGNRMESFDLNYAPENMLAAIDYAFAWSELSINSWLLSIMGLGGVLTLIVKKLLELRRIGDTPQVSSSRLTISPPWIFYFGGIALHFCVLMAFNFGVFNEFVTARLSLPLHPALAFVAVIAAGHSMRAFFWSAVAVSSAGFLWRLQSWGAPEVLDGGLHLLAAHAAVIAAGGFLITRRRVRRTHVAGIILLYFIVSTLPRVSSHRYLDHYGAHQFYYAFLEVMEERRGESALFVTDVALPALLHREPVITTGGLKKRAKFFATRMELHHAYEAVYFVQVYRFSHEQQRWIADDTLLEGDEFEVNFLETHPVTSMAEFRIFRVKPASGLNESN